MTFYFLGETKVIITAMKFLSLDKTNSGDTLNYIHSRRVNIQMDAGSLSYPYSNAKYTNYSWHLTFLPSSVHFSSSILVFGCCVQLNFRWIISYYTNMKIERNKRHQEANKSISLSKIIEYLKNLNYDFFLGICPMKHFFATHSSGLNFNSLPVRIYIRFGGVFAHFTAARLWLLKIRSNQKLHQRQ